MPSSTQRRLVRYTVEVPTRTSFAIRSSVSPSAAASRICARLAVRTNLVPLLTSALSSSRSSSLRVTTYRTFMRASCPRQDHSPKGMSIPAEFTELQGQYLAFIHVYTKLHRRPPAEADLQRYF